jgi:hypothetical protein
MARKLLMVVALFRSPPLQPRPISTTLTLGAADRAGMAAGDGIAAAAGVPAEAHAPAGVGVPAAAGLGARTAALGCLYQHLEISAACT